MVLGSPKYMSPEQVMGKLTDQRSDIFSLGVMLYEMLTGQPAFTGENVNAIMYQTLNAIPQPPKSLNPAVPEMLNFIVAKALAKDLDNRYQNARDLANDLRACRGTMPSSVISTDVANPANTISKTEMTSAGGESDDEADPGVTMRLSPSFDSAGATMRLAAMTASQEDVDELSKTFKMARPSIEEINRAAPQSPVFAKHTLKNTSHSVEESRSTKGGGIMLMAIVVLILIGLISALLF
jgi:serine/threonine-protein kinase